MTTDQIMVTETSSGTTEDDAALRSRSEQEAKQIVATARYAAFKMVTDARAEAESILAEQAASAPPEPDSRSASQLLEAAEVEAAAIIKAAESEATSASDRWIQNLEQANEGLLAEHEVLSERLSSTKQLLEHLEARLVQIAAVPAEIVPPSSNVEPPQTPNLPTVLPLGAPGPSTNPREAANDSIDAGSSDDAPVAPEVSRKHPAAAPSMEAAATAESDGISPIDYSPSVPRPNPLVADEEPLPDDRGSFYSRRSANLPSIGESVGKDTLTAMRSMRQVIAQTD